MSADMTPKQAAEIAHRRAVEIAVREHPTWSTRDFARHWGDVNHATVSRWFRQYGLKTNPRYGKPPMVVSGEGGAMSDEATQIEHDERCVWDHVLYGNCFHTEEGQRIEAETT